MEQRVDLNFKDFPGQCLGASSFCGLPNPVEPSRETSSSQYYLAHDATRQDRYVVNNRFTGKFLLNFSSDNYPPSNVINQ